MEFNEMVENVKRLFLTSCAALFAASYFPARLPTSEYYYLISSVFIIALAFPSYCYLYRWLGASKSLLIVSLLSVLSVLVEALAVATGHPYGGFRYSEALGYRVLGLVPWSVAFAYLPLLLGSATLASHLFGSDWLRFGVGSTAILVGVDLVVDPAAVAGGLWIWDEAGVYYGVPLGNFLGWLLTGFLYSTILLIIVRADVRGDGAVPLEVSSSLLMILSFWTGFLIWKNLTFPAVLGALMVASIGYLFHKS